MSDDTAKPPDPESNPRAGAYSNASSAGRTSPRRVASRLKMQQALELRVAGAPLRVIAEKLDYSISGARKAVAVGLREVLREPAEELIRLETERTEAALLALWPQVTRGSVPAIRAAVAVLERRAKLLGLDAPTRVTSVLTGQDGKPVEIHATGMNLAALSTEKLRALETLLAEATAAGPELPPAPPPVPGVPTNGKNGHLNVPELPAGPSDPLPE